MESPLPSYQSLINVAQQNHYFIETGVVPDPLFFHRVQKNTNIILPSKKVSNQPIVQVSKPEVLQPQVLEPQVVQPATTTTTTTITTANTSVTTKLTTEQTNNNLKRSLPTPDPTVIEDSPQIAKRKKTQPTCSKSEKRYVCQFEGCGKSFPRSGSRTRHHRTHTGERPYVCKFIECQKTFSDSSHLRRHEKIHLGEKPFLCSLGCGKRFQTAFHVKRHEKIHQSGQNIDSTDDSE
eukprot:c19870_g1_i1.p1 GENE.c19870_g1_i1~~c19870_g1_i1.p1  ORF type:complete len:236 (-),score=71.55 c19870_g1_i1:8-715(-)